ncbi:MAG: CRISPR-associated endonuclease Cas1 [Methylacidiphilaceae bacterium]|nr:CRISPR-associated endonuclease Cas1 [Candidatus Methylacidiphilaceae bacterium]
MLNEFVYCPRLFYYEQVEGLFRENADTVRGLALHARVDAGSGAMPSPLGENTGEAPRETIHSRSVLLGSERWGVTAKIDLMEVQRDGSGETGLLVSPVDYKAGSPREGQEGKELWDADRMQLGLQCLLLRENGYRCEEGMIYYQTTRQRVRLHFTPELESWILANLEAARRCAAGPIPPPLLDSPKCVRCSLATICLPDETHYLQTLDRPPEEEAPPTGRVRRLIAPRDETRPLYLETQGLRVGISDGNLQIREKDSLREEVRLRDLCHLALFGNVQLSTQAIHALCFRNVPITYFSTGGWFYGITRGHDLHNVFLRIEQFRAAGDPIASLALARCFVSGKIRNQRTMCLRNHVEPPPATLAQLRRLAASALQAGSCEELLGIEGAAAALYFREFAGMLRPAPRRIDGGMEPGREPELSFHFEGRNRRPPTDPINALLSLAYSLLSKDCTLAALAVGFDPYVGFYHRPRFGRPALALDFMEEFRPLIADSSVLLAVNNRIITERDFVRAGKAVSLSSSGRKRFFPVYEKRMSDLVTHPVFGYKVSYRRAIELQYRIGARVLQGEIAQYTPFLTR